MCLEKVCGGIEKDVVWHTLHPPTHMRRIEPALATLRVGTRAARRSTRGDGAKERLAAGILCVGRVEVGMAGRVGGPGEVAGRVGCGWAGRAGGKGGWRAGWGRIGPSGWGWGGGPGGGGPGVVRAGVGEGWYERSYSPKGCLYGGVNNALEAGRMRNLEKSCSGLEKRCHDIEESGKMLEKKNSIIRPVSSGRVRVEAEAVRVYAIIRTCNAPALLGLGWHRRTPPQPFSSPAAPRQQPATEFQPQHRERRRQPATEFSATAQRAAGRCAQALKA